MGAFLSDDASSSADVAGCMDERGVQKNMAEMELKENDCGLRHWRQQRPGPANAAQTLVGASDKGNNVRQMLSLNSDMFGAKPARVTSRVCVAHCVVGILCAEILEVLRQDTPTKRWE